MPKRADQTSLSVVVDPDLLVRLEKCRKQMSKNINFRRLSMGDVMRSLIIDSLDRRDQETWETK